jgi:hypothetical protein
MSLESDVLNNAIIPALALLPAGMKTDKALVLELAIMGQESGWKDRYQVVAGGGKGPARGLAQFERGGGVKGVLEHPASAALAGKVCTARRVPTVASVVWEELEHDDILAACFARLLLYTDPHPLPEIGDEQGAWDYYVRNWRPGKPHRDRWGQNYAKAVAAVGVA